MAPNSLTERNDEMNVQAREETRSNERFIRPAVNIIETEEGLFVTADLPGATKERIDVNVEKGVLTISAPAAHSVPGSAVYREFELGSYFRQFTIPESLDHGKAKADFANGILTLRIPKAEIARPRRIEVQVS
ncbi:Hsp20/alpha crystallin family protein [Geomonas subterranea]|uniref:Hsp20/alpha crystallin family protein n=1 Tax=Geomonas subterranea TaxID=2847989 RepID=A0ABX8LEJ4_9BACT|nr:Hsp20/alpha crystallin family protein [Geomonas subterranea]QXE90412.1 Hsp20/alpha crystallin family protein [Geomonas subterranea]QXM11513.1 Hsp20/alpha crystallin family protein [Geomonas subterranea]